MYTFFKNIMPRWCHIRPAYFLQVLLIAGFMILSGATLTVVATLTIVQQ